MSSIIKKEVVDEILDRYVDPHADTIERILEYHASPLITEYNVDEIESMLDSLLEISDDIKLAIVQLKRLCKQEQNKSDS